MWGALLEIKDNEVCARGVGKKKKRVQSLDSDGSETNFNLMKTFRKLEKGSVCLFVGVV